LVSSPQQVVGRAAARKALKDSLRKKLDRAKSNHYLVLKDAKISTNFASFTATVVRERLSQSALDTVFSSLVRDIAIANKVGIFVHPMEKVAIEYVDHKSRETIAIVTKDLETIVKATPRGV
jgi:hypothetical protein